jgi:hypothetical protein
MKYQVIVAGTVLGTYATKEEAEAHLELAKNSFLAFVHPADTFFIKKI